MILKKISTFRGWCLVISLISNCGIKSNKYSFEIIHSTPRSDIPRIMQIIPKSRFKNKKKPMNATWAKPFKWWWSLMIRNVWFIIFLKSRPKLVWKIHKWHFYMRLCHGTTLQCLRDSTTLQMCNGFIKGLILSCTYV